jgi:hypothetical protein
MSALFESDLIGNVRLRQEIKGLEATVVVVSERAEYLRRMAIRSLFTGFFIGACFGIAVWEVFF